MKYGSGSFPKRYSIFTPASQLREKQDYIQINTCKTTNKHSAKNKTKRKQRRNPLMFTEKDRLQSRDNIGDPTDLSSL